MRIHVPSSSEHSKLIRSFRPIRRRKNAPQIAAKIRSLQLLYLRLYDLAIFSVIIVLSLFLQLVQNASIQFEVREYGKSMRDFAYFLIQTIENRGNFFLIPRCCKTAVHIHGRTGRKKLGGRKEICPTFSDFARPVPKKVFVEIYFGDLPPPPRTPMYIYTRTLKRWLLLDL
jgi:hypothetical protein